MILHTLPLSLALCALLTGCRTSAPSQPAEPIPDESEPAEPTPAATSPRAEQLQALADELLEMAATDQEIRDELVAFVKEHPGEDPSLSLALRMLSTDAKNTARIQEIVATHGWPTPELVGDEASRAAWLLVQHADSEPGFQATVLEMVAPMLETGGIEKTDYALLMDRVLVAEGKAQRYGSQYVTRTVDGVTTFEPTTAIEDPEHLDERRATLELGPHADYVALLRTTMGIPENVPVSDP